MGRNREKSCGVVNPQLPGNSQCQLFTLDNVHQVQRARVQVTDDQLSVCCAGCHVTGVPQPRHTVSLLQSACRGLVLQDTVDPPQHHKQTRPQQSHTRHILLAIGHNLTPQTADLHCVCTGCRLLTFDLDACHCAFCCRVLIGRLQVYTNKWHAL